MNREKILSARLSNQVYVWNEKKLMIPAYITMLIKSMRDIDMVAGSLSIDYTLIIRFGCEGIDDANLIENNLHKKIHYRFNENIYSKSPGDEGVNTK